MKNYIPEFNGSTSGWLQTAETEEKYTLIWANETNQNHIFEMPTGGTAVMLVGSNLTYFAKKEQCLALGKQLKNNFKINNYKIFRVFPTKEIQFLHPNDGIFPEKANQGRIPVGKNDFSIGKNKKVK
jgi:photosystem I subunit 2